MMRKIKIIGFVLVGFAVIGLLGCSGLPSQFHCNDRYPERCLSLDEANQLALKQSYPILNKKGCTP